jgi:hypothetical protein
MNEVGFKSFFEPFRTSKVLKSNETPWEPRPSARLSKKKIKERKLKVRESSEGDRRAIPASLRLLANTL